MTASLRGAQGLASKLNGSRGTKAVGGWVGWKVLVPTALSRIRAYQVSRLDSTLDQHSFVRDMPNRFARGRACQNYLLLRQAALEKEQGGEERPGSVCHQKDATQLPRPRP